MSNDKVVRRGPGNDRRNPFVDPPAGEVPTPREAPPRGADRGPRDDRGAQAGDRRGPPRGRDDRPRNDRPRDEQPGRDRSRREGVGPESWPAMQGDAAARLDLGSLEELARMDMSAVAEALEGSANKSRIAVGQKVQGIVTRVGDENVFVDVGAKSEATLEREDLPDAKVGDLITAYVIEVDENGIRVSQKLSGSAAAAFVDEAKRAGVPVEGRVASRNPGGFEIRIGAVRAFCPVSQIDRRPDLDLDTYLGQTYEFKVLEAGEDVVVSRRALLEEGLEERRTTFWQEVEVGQVLTGVISNIQPFGVFVDLDGVDGLVPKRERSWEEVSDPAGRFARGQKIEVRVLDIDHDRKKLVLSARDPAMSPWNKVSGGELEAGRVMSGLVVRTAPFGVFIDVGGGLQGLLHVSRAGGRLPDVGATIDVEIVSVDGDKRRIELALPGVAATEAPSRGPVAPRETVILDGTIRQVKEQGLVLELDDGTEGWVPAREIDLPANTVLAQRFRAGRKVKARLVEEDASGRRKVMSLKLEGGEDENWRRQPTQGGGGGFGTFAALLGTVKVTAPAAPPPAAATTAKASDTKTRKAGR